MFYIYICYLNLLACAYHTAVWKTEMTLMDQLPCRTLESGLWTLPLLLSLSASGDSGLSAFPSPTWTPSPFSLTHWVSWPHLSYLTIIFPVEVPCPSSEQWVPVLYFLHPRQMVSPTLQPHLPNYFNLSPSFFIVFTREELVLSWDRSPPFLWSLTFKTSFRKCAQCWRVSLQTTNINFSAYSTVPGSPARLSLTRATEEGSR